MIEDFDLPQAGITLGNTEDISSQKPRLEDEKVIRRRKVIKRLSKIDPSIEGIYTGGIAVLAMDKSENSDKICQSAHSLRMVWALIYPTKSLPSDIKEKIKERTKKLKEQKQADENNRLEKIEKLKSGNIFQNDSIIEDFFRYEKCLQKIAHHKNDEAFKILKGLTSNQKNDFKSLSEENYLDFIDEYEIFLEKNLLFS